jgi:hypothetical protein
MYAHHPSYNLEPRTLGIALTRGLVGHTALELYYNKVSSGDDHDEGLEAVQTFIMKKSAHEIMYGDSSKAEMIAAMGVILAEYLNEFKYLVDTYDILGVEQLVTAPLPETDGIDFAGRIDVVFGIKSGPNKGEAIPWDHKFCYNFWSDSSLKMNPQLPNYIWALNRMGVRSRKGVMNMIRHRDNAQERFSQEEVFASTTKQAMFIKNHTVAAKQIVDLKLKDEVDIDDGVTRSPSKFNCEYCPFIDLCTIEAEGRDSKNTIQAHYRPNSYGYVDTELDIQ